MQKRTPDYLAGYPDALRAQVQALRDGGQLGDWLRARHADCHAVRTDRSLYAYTQDLKNTHLRGAEPLAKVAYDSKLQVMAHALGTHTTISRVQGGKLKAKREIRVASLFKAVPEPWLRMIVVHELAHLRERDHNRAFYQLCTHMAPDYHQRELELRMYLSWRDAHPGELLWSAAGMEADDAEQAATDAPPPSPAR